jgi:hypothetical protein
MNYRWAFSVHFMNHHADTSFPVFLVCVSERSLGACSSFAPTAFGFLPGKEVKEAGVGNLGLQDRESTILRLEAVRSCVRRAPRFEVGTDVRLRVRWRPFKSDDVSDKLSCKFGHSRLSYVQLGGERRCHFGGVAHANGQREPRGFVSWRNHAVWRTHPSR